MDLAQLGIKVTSDGMSQAQSGLDNLTRSGASAESQMQRLGSTSSSVAGQVAILTAALASAYAAYKSLSEAIAYGMRVETLGVAMNVVAKNAGVSTDAIQYFSKEVKAAGITSTEAFSVITKAMVQGIDLNKMKDLATRARDIAVVAGQNTSDTFVTIMHGIESGMPRIFHTLGIAVRDQKTIFDEYATSVGKTGKELNQVEKATATLNEVMRASAGYAGAAAAADETVGKQIATLDRVVKDTYESFWTLFGPGMSSGVLELTQAFKDLQQWAKNNQTELQQLGSSVGEFVKQAGEAGIATGKWLLENKDLVVGLGELYICVKAVGWVAALTEAIIAAAGAATLAAGAIGALISIAGGLGVLGAVKSFQGKGDIGGGPNMYLNPEDPYQYLNQAEDKGYDLFAKKRTQHMEDIISGGQSWSKKISGSLDLESYATAGINRAEATTAAEYARLHSAGGAGGKGGGGGAGKQEGAEASVRKFVETMAQETAKGAGDTEAILTAWKNKQLQTLEELATKGADITKAKEALNEAVASKQKKLDSDFNDWYIAGMGNQYEALVKTENKKLAEVAGNEAKTAQVHEVYAKKKADLDDQVQSNTMNLFKGYLDTMASLSPTLEGQLKLKRESLALELKISDAALERQIREKQINPELADQARAMAAVAAQAKKFNLEMENDKGIKGWAYGRSKSDNQKNIVSDMMGGLESGLQSSFSSAWQGFLTHDKQNLAKAGQSIFQGILGEVTKGSITKTFSGLAGMIAPKSPLDQYGMTPGSGQGVQSAGAGLSKAAEGLNKASIGFNANTAQFGLAAGGLLLSGIGIATNSQFLVYAGEVLQIAGLAIQIYEALTATTTVTSMTTAAGALTVSAGALTASAVALAAAAGASGGSSAGGILSGLGSVVDVVAGFLHDGGAIGPGGAIYAHAGWPRLKSDEVPIIAQTGERVLSRRQNRDYEAGMVAGGGGGGGGGGLSIGAIHIDARGASKDIDWGHVVKRQIIPEIDKHLGKRGLQKIGGGR